MKATEVVTEWLDASYTAFKVPIGIALYQEGTSLGVLSCFDFAAGALPHPCSFASVRQICHMPCCSIQAQPLSDDL